MDNDFIFQIEEVAKYICKKYYEENKQDISEIKLQKCLYFLFAYWGGFVAKSENEEVEEKINYSKYLFKADFQAWVYGPVSSKIYFLRKNSSFNYDDLDVNEMFKDKNFVKETIDSLLHDLFEISDFKLVSLSHNDKVWQDNFDVFSEYHNEEMKMDAIIDEYAYREAV